MVFEAPINPEDVKRAFRANTDAARRTVQRIVVVAPSSPKPSHDTEVCVDPCCKPPIPKKE